MKIEEELIIKLTLHSLDNFIKYKELNLSNKISFSSILSTICIKACIKYVLYTSITHLIQAVLK